MKIVMKKTRATIEVALFWYEIVSDELDSLTPNRQKYDIFILHECSR